jgi:type I restriction enzyme S subunit
MATKTRRATLGDYFTLQRGTTYKSRLLGEPGPVLLGLATILRNGGFRSDSLRTYGGASPDKLLVRAGELYVSLKDVTQAADLLGAVARLPPDHAPGRLTQDTVKLAPKADDVPLDYLYWLMRTPVYRSHCRAHATGTTNLGLAREDFLAFPVPELTPSRSLIVTTLDTLDDKIELNRRMNETLEAMARALFKSWFVDFDPVRAKAEGRAPSGVDEETARLFPSGFQSSEMGDIPNGWGTTNLADLTAKIGSGATPRGGDKVYVESGVALIRSQNVYDSEFVWEGLVRLTDEDASSLASVSVVSGDVLLNITGASILRTCVVIPDVLPARVNQHVAIIRAKRGIPPTYLHQHLLRESTKSYLLGMDAGASRQAVTKSHIESVPTLRPTDEVLDRWRQITAPWFAMADVRRAETTTLTALRDALLPRLLSSEIDVSTAERFAGAAP